MARRRLSIGRFGFLLLAIIHAIGCQDVDQRRLASLRHLHLSNKKMEQHVRAALLAATPMSLRQPQLLIAHRAVFNGEGGPAATLVIDEVNIVWMESTPSIDGVRLFSRLTNDAVDLHMTAEQIATVKKESRRGVVFGEAFRMTPALTQTLGKLLEDGDVDAVLLSKGQRVSSHVPFQRW